MRLAALAFLALVVAPSTRAASPVSPRESLVVSSQWLSSHLKDPDLVLLHVGDKDEYLAAHLPGARFVNLQDISVSDRTGTGNGLVLEMPPAEVLRERLAALGVSDSSRIVVYFGKDWVSPSTRVVFTLDYAGLGGRTSLLDGGQPAWVRDGQPVTTVVPEVKPGTLSALTIKPLVVSADFVHEHVGTKGSVLVDARDATFYEGTMSGGDRSGPPKLGHLPGALSLPFTETTTDQLMLLSPEALEARFAKAGVKKGDTVIGYCHIGQQATATLFAARTLGYNVLLYDGSFQDWVRRGNPLETPTVSAPKEK